MNRADWEAVFAVSRDYVKIALQTGRRLNTVKWWAQRCGCTRKIPHLTRTKKAQLIAMHEAGYRYEVIARTLGIHRRTVVRLNKQYGLDNRRSKTEYYRSLVPKVWVMLSKAMSWTEIAAALGLSGQALNYGMKKVGGPTFAGFCKGLPKNHPARRRIARGLLEYRERQKSTSPVIVRSDSELHQGTEADPGTVPPADPARDGLQA